MERPIFKPVGTPVDQLDTPALVIDLPILQQNIETMHSFFRDRDVGLRPRVEAHRCPAIAHRQVAAGGTAGGISVTTVGQAEVFAASGFNDILVANIVVTPLKISRLCAVARRATMTVAVDDARNVRSLSEAASTLGVTLEVMVAIDTGLGSFGVQPGQPAANLAKEVSDAEGLSFAGLTAVDGAAPLDDSDRLAAESRRSIQQVIDTREMVEKAGMKVKAVSVGGTHNYEIAAEMEGVTEILAGSYALMDQRHVQHRPQFRPAAMVMATVTSTPEAGKVITDAGQKAIGADTGAPFVAGVPGARAGSLSAEHGAIELDASANGRLDLRDKVSFIPWDIGTCANLHDYMFGVREGKLEAVWEIAARGRYR
jgi:D-serine deaminase-like pyridoxal phosphate-dependent protein